jgi:hypothetical protein
MGSTAEPPSRLFAPDFDTELRRVTMDFAGRELVFASRTVRQMVKALRIGLGVENE